MTTRPHVTLAVDQARRKLIDLRDRLNEDAWEVVIEEYTHEDADQLQYIENALGLFGKLIDELERAR
jgi:hypothetical protein